MKVYFKEKAFCDTTNGNFDGCYPEFSFTPYEVSEQCGDTLFYTINISDKYSTQEVRSFCTKAVKTAFEDKVTVLFALSNLIEYELI